MTKFRKLYDGIAVPRGWLDLNGGVGRPNVIIIDPQGHKIRVNAHEVESDGTIIKRVKCSKCPFDDVVVLEDYA